jgi:hypothetical protein
LRLQVSAHILKSKQQQNILYFSAVLFTIQLGSAQLVSDDPNRMTVATSTYILHPDFKPDTIENDIGLIKFRRPVDYNSKLMFVEFVNTL